MRQVYLDYSATTPVKEEVVQEMIPFFTETYGNPSSLYSGGLSAKAGMEKARANVAKLINSRVRELFFTGGGTEADNWAIQGAAEALKDKGRHIITSRIEHHAVLHSCEYLEKQGFEVTYLDVDEDGFVKPETLKEALRDDTILVSIMMVNNEIGTIQPIKELAAITKEHGAVFHTDAVQAVGNMPIDVKDLDVDMLSMSAHKIYGPKGIGALYIKQGTKVGNFIHGGAQESKKRAGTENLPAIVGFGKAAELCLENMESHIQHCTELRDYLWGQIYENVDGFQLNGPLQNRHPANLNISFDYIEGEAILLMLDQMGISVSTGSACSSKSLEPSHVLQALEVPLTCVNGTVRFTVGDFTTKEDIDYTVSSLIKVVNRLRRMSPVRGWEGL